MEETSNRHKNILQREKEEDRRKSGRRLARTRTLGSPPPLSQPPPPPPNTTSTTMYYYPPPPPSPQTPPPPPATTTTTAQLTIRRCRQLPTVGPPGGSRMGFLSLRADNFRLKLACARRMDRKRQTTPAIPAET